LANSFLKMFVIVRIRFLWKKKLEKLPGKLENSGKTETAFFYGIFVMDIHNFFFFFDRRGFDSREKVFRKKNRDNYKGKSDNSGKLQKLYFLYAKN
jgi:hypothetical protein